MLAFLRLVGIINAAIWLGACVAWGWVVSPAFMSRAMLKLLPVAHAGAAELIVGGHMYVLQYCCVAIAAAHVLGEWLYAGRSPKRWPAYLVGGVAGLALLGGLVLQPKLRRLHLDLHGQRSTPQQRERAGGAFQGWQVVAHAVNVLSIVGLAGYVWQVAAVGSGTRFGGAARFRGLTNDVS